MTTSPCCARRGRGVRSAGGSSEQLVDQPRRTVEQAEELVAQMMQRLAESFASERERLEGQVGRAEDVSTEDCASR